MLSFYLIWSLSYFTILWWAGRKWRGSKTVFSSTLSYSPVVTLIVPFRNEEDNLPNLIANLNKIQYPDLEILLIDDHSEDGSLGVLAMQNLTGISVLHSSNPGKKSALEFGVKQARGEIIVCSDADCSFSKYWIKTMVSPFLKKDIQLVAGPVMVGDRGRFLDKFQLLDWASIVLMTTYSFERKRPLMCSGANLAYRKEAFERVQGYNGNRHFASGDDEFLLKKISKHYGEDSCIYLTSPQVLVSTKSEPAWRALIQQRVRWAGKWNAHSSATHSFSAIVALVANMVWIGSFCLMSFGMKGIVAFGGIWMTKVMAEKFSLGKVLRRFNIVPHILYFILTSLLHPFYVLRVALGALRGKFIWKGRENWRSVNLESEI